MNRGNFVVGAGFIVAGIAFAAFADLISTRLTTNVICVYGGAFLAALVVFVIYGVVVTKMGK